MEIFLLIVAAILPAAVLLYYAYRKDSLQREPPKELFKAFGVGTLAVFLSLFISHPLEMMGLFSLDYGSVWGAISTAFIGAAIPEEIAKFLLFILLVRKNKWFNERMDGVVYAVCVSLGFAALENIGYLAQNFESWVAVGIARALLSVPGHFFFGVLMGYYYSIVKFSANPTMMQKILVLVAPILAHGIFDSLLLAVDLVPSWSAALMLFFLYMLNILRRMASDKIEQHLKADSQSVESTDKSCMLMKS